MRRALVLLLIAVGLAAAEGWETWWQRAERDLQLADRTAARAARAADPPPPGSGGLALAHHRLLLAWLGGDATAGPTLAAVRAESHRSIRLLAPGTPLAATTDLPPAAGAGFHQAVMAGGPPELATFAAAMQQKRGDAMVWAVHDALRELHWRDVLWVQEPAEARRTTGLDQAPAFIPPLEAECLYAAAQCLADDQEYQFDPAERAFAARVGATCPPPWQDVAWWIALKSPVASQPRAAAEQALALAARISAAARSHAALLRLAMPALEVWATDRRWQRRFGLTVEAAAMVAMLRQHLDDPPGAAAAMAAFQAAGTAWLAETAWESRRSDTDDSWIGVCNRRGALAPAIAAWAGLSDRLATWAAANAALGRRLPGWSDAEAATALARLEALEPELATAREGLAAGPLSRACWEGLQAMLAQVRTALTTHRVVLAAQRAGETRVLTAIDRRDTAVSAVAAARTSLAKAESALALINGASIPSLPVSCGLGEPLASAPGRSDVADIDQPLLSALAAEPWHAVAVRLVAMRRAATAEVAPTWQQLRRRHALFAALGAAGHPDLDLIAADLTSDGATASAAVLRSARRSPAIPPSVETAVQAWLATAARPASGRQSPPARALTADERTERFMCLAAACGDSWSDLAAQLIESPADPAVLARQEALTAIAAPDAELAALARDGAALLHHLRHFVAEAHLRLAADPDPQARQRYLAAARTWLTAEIAERRTP